MSSSYSSCYMPPIYMCGIGMDGVGSSSVLSPSEKVHMELSNIRSSFHGNDHSKGGNDSPAMVALRRQEEHRIMMRDTIIGSLIVSFSLAVGLLAMYVEASYICYVAFTFPFVTGPYAVHQRRKIHKLPSFRAEHNKLRLRIMDLQHENMLLEALQKNVGRQVSRLQDTEQQLTRIVQEQNGNLTTFAALVKENGRIQRDMKRIQESRIMTDIIKAIVSSDQSRDFIVDDKEMNVLMMRLRAIQGVTIHEESLRKAFAASSSNSRGGGRNHSLKTLVDITKEILAKDQLQLVRDVDGARPSLL